MIIGPREAVAGELPLQRMSAIVVEASLGDGPLAHSSSTAIARANDTVEIGGFASLARCGDHTIDCRPGVGSQLSPIGKWTQAGREPWLYNFGL